MRPLCLVQHRKSRRCILNLRQQIYQQISYFQKSRATPCRCHLCLELTSRDVMGYALRYWLMLMGYALRYWLMLIGYALMYWLRLLLMLSMIFPLKLRYRLTCNFWEMKILIFRGTKLQKFKNFRITENFRTFKNFKNFKKYKSIQKFTKS